MLILKNAMNSKIDVNIIMPIKLMKSNITINQNNIVKIKHKYSKYDKINLNYFVITLSNNDKIYVNSWIVEPTGLFSGFYSKNDDYDIIKTLFN